jgi:hypothetical protein
MSRKLGTNGPGTSDLGLGAMGMSGMYGHADEAESIATIHALPGGSDGPAGQRTLRWGIKANHTGAFMPRLLRT